MVYWQLRGANVRNEIHKGGEIERGAHAAGVCGAVHCQEVPVAPVQELICRIGTDGRLRRHGAYTA